MSIRHRIYCSYLRLSAESEIKIKSVAAKSVDTKGKRKNLLSVALSKIIPVRAKDRFSPREKEAMIKIKCQNSVTEIDSDESRTVPRTVSNFLNLPQNSNHFPILSSLSELG